MFNNEVALAESGTSTLDKVANLGERAVVDNTWSFWAHLSIYHFALPYTNGKRVLDAGSGSGYGAAYLANHGANVTAFDVSTDAIAHSKTRYAGLPVTYEVADFNKPLPVKDRVFDTIFSSNVFEHVSNIDCLIAECARALKPEGVAIVAVPPVINAAVMESDMRNQFHVQHIPPSAWQAKLSRFFEAVVCHTHKGTGAFASDERTFLEIRTAPKEVVVRETDFQFPVASPIQIEAEGAITAVFVCHRPREQPLPETIIERTPAAWCEGAVAGKLIGEGLAREAELISERDVLASELAGVRTELDTLRADFGLAQQLRSAVLDPSAAVLAQLAAVQRDRDELRATIDAIHKSTSWRLTAPLRKVRTMAAVRGAAIKTT